MVGKTLRSQKMEARLRNVSEDDRESDYYSYSVRESAADASQVSYSTYGDSAGGRGRVYEPDTSTFGVGGALPGRTQRILEKQKKLEGLLADRHRRRYDEDTCVLSTIADSYEEGDPSDEEDCDGGEAADGDGSAAAGEMRGPSPGSGAPVVYYVMAPGGGQAPAGAFPPGFQFPPGFDPNILSLAPGAGAGETAVGLEGRPLSEEALATLETQRAAAMQQYMHSQQQQGVGGLPAGINAQTLAMAQQLTALSATTTPGSTPDVSAATGDPLGIDLPTLLLAKQLSALNEQLKAAGGDVGGGMDPTSLLMQLSQLSRGGHAPPSPPHPPAAAATPVPDMSAVHDTLAQMKDMMLAMQRMHMQQPSGPTAPSPPPQAPVQHFVPPAPPSSLPAPVLPQAPQPPACTEPPTPEQWKKTHRELPPVLYRLVPHRSKFKRANELFETDVDMDYYSEKDEDGGSVKSNATHATSESGRNKESLRNKAKAGDRRRDKQRERDRDRPARKGRKEEAAFSLESFAPPRNGGVGGDERFTVAPCTDDSSSTSTRRKDKRGDHRDQSRSSQFRFDNPLLSPPVDPAPRKSQDDFWIDPSAEDHMVDKVRRSSKDDLEIERKSSMLSLTSNALYKKRVHLKPGGHRRENLRDSCGSASSIS